MFQNLLSKLALVTVTATVGLGVITSPAHGTPAPRPNVQSVPEPTSIVGLLAIGAVGTVSLLKRTIK